MGDRAADEAYSVLIEWLRLHELEWVAEQVSNEVTLGKARSERISVASEIASPFDLDIYRRRGARTKVEEFIGREDYSPKEKFEMAVGAIQTVVLGGIKIKDALAETLGVENGAVEINFVEGETGESRHSYRPVELQSRRFAATKLESLLRDLREDVEREDTDRVD